MLDNARVATRLPTQDLDRARRFYADMLGLEPTEERPGGLRYQVANGEFALYDSAGVAPGTFTQMAFEVDDHAAVVAEINGPIVGPMTSSALAQWAWKRLQPNAKRVIGRMT